MYGQILAQRQRVAMAHVPEDARGPTLKRELVKASIDNLPFQKAKPLPCFPQTTGTDADEAWPDLKAKKADSLGGREKSRGTCAQLETQIFF